MKFKQIVILGLISFTVLFILSLIFYRERTIFTDISFHIFYLAKEGNFAIQNNRFGAFITQIFPLIGIKLHMELNQIMLLYSGGFVFYYFLIFVLIAIVLKNKEMALIMILWPVLFVSHTFFWIQSELPQGMAFMLMFFAFYDYIKLKHQDSKVWNVILILLLGFLSGFHPILIIPFTFIILFKILNLENKKGKEAQFLVLLTVLFFIFILAKSLLASGSGYETTALGGLHNFIKLFPNYFSLESNQNFITNCIKAYYFIPIILIVIIVHYLKTKNKLKLWLSITFFFGYLLLINVSYYHNAPAHYIENLYLPLSIILLLPFVYDILPVLKISIQKSIIIVIVIVGLFRIYYFHNTYTTRLKWETHYLEVNPNKKLIIDQGLMPLDTLIDYWATPYEFWLLSTSTTNNSASILITDSIENYFYSLPLNKDFIITEYKRYSYSEFNSKYFNFNDTTRYKIRKPD